MASRNKLVVWDCDGVLVDSEAVLKRGEVRALAEAGITVTVDDCVSMFSGVSTDQAALNFKTRMNMPLPEDFFKKQVAASMDLFRKPGELKALMSNTVSCLHASQIPMCVASGSPRDRVLLCLEIAGIANCFPGNYVFTREQVSRGKPAPDLFLFAAEKMGFKPEDCIVVEDAVAGIQAARAAGMKVISYLGGGHAQSSWYREAIVNQGVEIFDHEDQVLQAIEQFMKE